MKFHQSDPVGVNTISGYGPDFVLVNGQHHERSLIVLPDRLILDWTATSFDALTAADLDALTRLDREVVLLGTGPRLRFPRPELLRPVTRTLAAARAGLEIMDVQAACRTYNILMAEERKVAAALLMS